MPWLSNATMRRLILALLLALLMPLQAWAALATLGAVNNSGTVAGGTQIIQSYTSTTTSNPSCLVVMLPTYSGAPSASAGATVSTWSGHTFTRVTPASASTADYTAEIFVAPLGSTHTAATANLQVDWVDTVYSMAIIQQIDNCHQTMANHHDGAKDEHGAGSGTASVTVANLVTTDWLIGTFIKGDGSVAYTNASSYTSITELVHPGLTTRRLLSAYITGLTGSNAISATFDSTAWAGAAVGLAEAAGGAATANFFMRRIQP